MTLDVRHCWRDPNYRGGGGAGNLVETTNT